MVIRQKQNQSSQMLYVNLATFSWLGAGGQKFGFKEAGVLLTSDGEKSRGVRQSSQLIITNICCYPCTYTHTHQMNIEFRDDQNPCKFAAHHPLLCTTLSKLYNHFKVNFHEGDKNTTFANKLKQLLISPQKSQPQVTVIISSIQTRCYGNLLC